mmetsp:Transcript_31543/g.80442  ORF Transcript_31543/g.80442 Transcript_31543/m.80442 type:complete len:116 (+) Transcript_31543:433-780(+)
MQVLPSLIALSNCFASAVCMVTAPALGNGAVCARCKGAFGAALGVSRANGELSQSPQRRSLFARRPPPNTMFSPTKACSSSPPSGAHVSGAKSADKEQLDIAGFGVAGVGRNSQD